jgi:hypothetical protein
VNFIFKFRVLLWSFVSKLECFLYPYKNREPEIDYYYIVKNDETGEKYTILEWIKSLNQRLEKIEDDIVFVNNEMRKIDKLDLTIIELKKIIYKNEKN